MVSKRQLKILLLEDSEGDALLIERTLRKDDMAHVLKVVESKAEFERDIREFVPDVVLSDHGLPQFNSLEALSITLKHLPNVPFILVTGSVSDEFAISCLRAGADDYLLKSNLNRLPNAIRNAVRKRTLDRLKRKARTALRNQNNELLKVNKELDTFVYSVSHNLRGPLASLMGLLTIAREADVDHTLGDVHDMMSITMQKLDDTLREIVNYSRNARGELQLGLIDWKQILDSVFHRLDYLFKEGNVGRTVELNCDVPFMSDADRIGVVLNNLISNAIIFRSPQRTAAVAIDISTDDQGARITVSDNGIGIRSEIMPKIWNMFYRGNEASRGAGLGLYVARETIARLQGSVSFLSEVNNGTQMVILLPNLQHDTDCHKNPESGS